MLFYAILCYFYAILAFLHIATFYICYNQLMIWVKENYKGKQVWYSKELLDEIKAICKRRPYQSLEKIEKVIEEAENGCI